ncbi:MAG: hypothetical protein RRZ85_04975, partial [Gordonibacter sp.]|uniref:hypothetical protein n=1 Tax=Gordonibacter sp. TaxID=1968902 RepID=UPI002FC90916
MRKKLLSFDAVGAKRVRCAFQCEVANAAAPAILVGKKSATRSCRNRHAELCLILDYVKNGLLMLVKR